MSAHEQYADDLALLALGQLQEDERAALETHLEGCAACRRELEQIRGDMALLALSAAGPAPPKRSRERLLKAIAREPRETKVVGRSSMWRMVPWMATAVFALAAVFFFEQSDRLSQKVAELQGQSAQQQSQLERAREVVATLTSTDAVRVTLVAAPGPAATTRESHLRSRPVQPGFHCQQHAGIACTKNLRTLADSNQRRAHSGWSF